MKTLYPLTAALALGISMPAAADINDDVEKLKEQVRALQAKQGGNNLKFNVDYRVSLDSIDYTMADGSTAENSGLLSNRLILNMGYAYNENLVFRGALSYDKAYGEQINTAGPYSSFDWVTNENMDSNELKVKEAYFLYLGDEFLGNDQLPWTFSLGRRPSTNGFLGNNREGFEEAKSPLAHSINVEFDGLSLAVKTDKLIGLDGSSIKLCAGRGLTNAQPRFSGTDYAKDEDQLNNIDFLGFIITPFNNGQYDLKAQIYYANNLIGMNGPKIMGAPSNPASYALEEYGDLSNATLSMEINGIGEFINDFLDDTRVFASYSMSKTHPNEGLSAMNGMLGSTESETGQSYWVGINVPGFLEDDSFGLEFNHGSQHWRSFTYGEDTLIGSKVAARGDAIELYYNLPVIDKALTTQLRYTRIDYDYTGSNGFFGSASAPMTMAEARANGMGSQTVEKAEDLRLVVRYKF